MVPPFPSHTHTEISFLLSPSFVIEPEVISQVSLPSGSKRPVSFSDSHTLTLARNRLPLIFAVFPNSLVVNAQQLRFLWNGSGDGACAAFGRFLPLRAHPASPLMTVVTCTPV